MNMTHISGLNSSLNGKKLQTINRLLKEAVFAALIQLIISSPSQAQKNHQKASVPSLQIDFSDSDILQQSQISYRAEGGFTGIISYGVIVSCSEGKISVLKSVHDPNLVDEEHKKHELSSMSTEQYLNLWRLFKKMNVFATKDIPDPKMDILDEFTFTFNVKVGANEHQFKVFGIDRPEASRHFAFKNIIDKTTDMASFWNSSQAVARKPSEQSDKN